MGGVTPISRRAAFAFWLKLGFISFGGPAGQIAIMHRELVEVRRWISEKRFLHALNYCMVLPGPEAQQLATYLGWLMHGTLGGIVAGALFVLPSLAILTAVSWAYMVFGTTPAAQALLYGIKPAVVALVLLAALNLAQKTLKRPALWLLALFALAAQSALSLPFPVIILGTALVGAILGRYDPAIAPAGSSHASATSAAALPAHLASAIIDDATPTPPHAQWRQTRAVVAVTVFAGLLVATYAAALLLPGSTFGHMARFFTQAALVTFGGAYAVLPYVFDAAVTDFGWLTAPQMMDGLALGESTPGPLIMVVAYIGFVGAWTKAAVGPDALWQAGVIGALVATWFTFLPSFFFILVGGPLVERTRESLRLAAPLRGITAAVVGMIAWLALVLAAHTFWPAAPALSQASGSWPAWFWGAATTLDFVAVLIAFAAGIALNKYRVSTLWVIAVCAAAGLVLR